jgi:hypothetical protein
MFATFPAPLPTMKDYLVDFNSTVFFMLNSYLQKSANFHFNKESKQM